MGIFGMEQEGAGPKRRQLDLNQAHHMWTCIANSTCFDTPLLHSLLVHTQYTVLVSRSVRPLFQAFIRPFARSPHTLGVDSTTMR